jgi:hypothetical protein
MIACIREEFTGEDERQRYLEQIAANQLYLRRYVASDLATSNTYTYWLPRWLSASPVNMSPWVTLVVSQIENRATMRADFLPQEAELSSLEDSRDAFQLYDAAVM